METFFLGTHMPSFLEKTNVPLFVSDARLRKMKTLPRARGIFAVDSAGFSELSLRGEWTVSARDYAARVRRYRDEIGGLQWAAIQDWMCEPQILKKTGLSEEEHQRRTIRSYLELTSMAPDLPWCPVLQGWGSGSHWKHAEMYAAAGINLASLPIVGVGSVCRRQDTLRVSTTIEALARVDGLRLHGFGFKTKGLPAVMKSLVSADSLAWSFNARKNPGMLGHAHDNCSNCLEFALFWRQEMLDRSGFCN